MSGERRLGRASPVCGTASREALSGPEAAFGVVKRPAAASSGWLAARNACVQAAAAWAERGPGLRVRLPRVQRCGCSALAPCACGFLSFGFCRANPSSSERGGRWHREGSHLWGSGQLRAGSTGDTSSGGGTGAHALENRTLSGASLAEPALKSTSYSTAGNL